MERHRTIKIGVLTSSRADFGIYLPLLQEIKKDNKFRIEIIAFGTHLSNYHGHTIDEIKKEGFKVKYKIESLLLHDSPAAISSSFSITSLKFAEFWGNHQNYFDWVLCLGDRFEMAAAVIAGIPMNVRFVHLYGGDITLGAIDNIYRSLISQVASLHIVATDEARMNVQRIAGENAKCIVAGSLSLTRLNNFNFMSHAEFLEKWKIDLSFPTILFTLHPETVNYKSNTSFLNEIAGAILTLCRNYQIVMTMPNADTLGTLFRKKLISLKSQKPDKIHIVENFGTRAYFTAMKYCQFVMGNSSSGIIESASFGIYAINIGDRQAGRMANDNVINVPFVKEEILTAVGKIKEKKYRGTNLYHKPGAIPEIISSLKEI